MTAPRYPSLYQVNTRVWLTELTQQLGRAATLDDIPNAELDRLADLGFDWIWFLSVWKNSLASRAVSRRNAAWRHEFEETLPDLKEDDIGGSGFAIEDYSAAPALGGNAALKRLRQRLNQRGLRLMLDFVPNHMGLAHPWLHEHADYFIAGTEDDLARAPQNYCRGPETTNDLILAYGRDPYFPGWPDTLQLNYANPALQTAMIGELSKIAGLCDGVRCDMAMLLLPDVFERTWDMGSEPFWNRAIDEVRHQFPQFLLMAEVYWDREWELQQQGFDYTYDKRLYDRLHGGQIQSVREHLLAGLDFQDKLARFLENHDEPRAAATFPLAQHRAAAVVTYLTPGLRFFHQGQFTGRRKRISPHLARRPAETADQELAEFYAKLLEIVRQPAFREGRWQLLECGPAWEGNGTSSSLIAWLWTHNADQRLVVVNLGSPQAQCRITIPLTELEGHPVLLTDLLSGAKYERTGQELVEQGLFVDLSAWEAHVFELTRC